jgi:hypothetical protein
MAFETNLGQVELDGKSDAVTGRSAFPLWKKIKSAYVGKGEGKERRTSQAL